MAVAAFTVVLPARLAVITLVPLAATAVNVLPLTVNTLVVPDVYVTLVPGVPPLPPLLVESVAVLPYLTVLGFIVNVNALVYFCTVTVTLAVPCATVVVLALVTVNATVLLLSSFAANVPATKFVPLMLLPDVLSVPFVADKLPPLFVFVKLDNVVVLPTYTV